MDLDTRALSNLKGVHPDLIRVVRRTAELTTESGFGWTITCGLRSLAEQKRLLAINATTTLKSRHLTGHAVDFVCKVDGKIRWDWPLYLKLSKIVKQAAKDCGVSIEWGGDWKSFKDGPHFQLPWNKYPG